MPHQIDIEEIIAATIAHTNHLLDRGEISIEIAVLGLSKILYNLSERCPEQSEMIYFQLTEWKRAHSN